MSTYNKKLPKVSDICFMNSKRTGRTETITMPFKGVIPSDIPYVGWRQSSYAYNYQVQYLVKARMIPDKQLETGSDTTKTAYKYFNSSWSGDVNKLNRSIKVDKKNRYFRYYSLSGKSLMTKGSYDKLTITVRVRSFNAKKKQHGAWVSNNLYVKCKPTVTVHKIVALADGGIQIYLNTGGWKRGDSEVILKDVRHEGVNAKQNKKNLVDEVGAIGTEEASGYPYAEFAGDLFNTDFEQNEKIVLKNCVFRTCDGVDVSLDGTYTISPIDADISEPNVTVTREEATGAMSVKIAKIDTADDWDNVKAWLNCTVAGKTIRFDSVMASGSDDSARMFDFYPPLDCELKLRVGIDNNLGGKFAKTYTVNEVPNLAPIPSDGRIIINYTDGTDEQPENGMFNGSKVAVMNYETEYSTDATRPHEIEMPFGRTRPIAFLGDGLEKSINIKGNIDGTETGEYATAEHSTYKDWEQFQEQQGIVLARLPFGRTYTALCTQLTIDQADEYDDSRNISMALSEVDI